MIPEHSRTVVSRDEFEALATDLSFQDDDQSLPWWSVPIGITITVFVVGVGISSIYGYVPALITNPVILVFLFSLFVSLATTLWFLQRLTPVITAIRPSFDVSDETYYLLMGDMVERVHEPFPHVYRRKGRIVHPPTALFTIGSFVLFFAVPVLYAPESFSVVFGWSWSTLPIGVKIYIAVLVGIASLVGTIVSWIVAVGVVYMGIRVRRFDIRLDITKASANLGLEPYARTLLRSLLAYLLVYFVVTSLLLVREPHPIILVGAFILSFLPLVGFAGAQYGLHRAIVRSKQQRLHQLRQEFEPELERWFFTEGPEPTAADDPRIAELLRAKQAIEALPNWPIRINSVLQLLSATITSNVVVVFQVIGYI